LFIGLFLCGAGFQGFAQDVLPFDDAIKDVLNYMTDRISAGSTVAILNFQSDYSNLSEYIIDDITSGMVNTDRYTVVDRRSLEILAQEMAFQLSGEVSDETALAIGRRVGAQVVISGAISDLGEFYRLRVQAIEVETARIQGSRNLTIQPNRLLATLTGKPWTAPGEPVTTKPVITEPVTTKPIITEPDKTAPASTGTTETETPASVTNRFYLGLRGGCSLDFFQPNTDFWGPDAYIDPKQTDGYFRGTAAIQASIQIFKFLAIQTEAVFSFPPRDTSPKVYFFPSENNPTWDEDGRFSQPSLLLPVLAKFTFRPGVFLLAGFGGVYFTVPLGPMTFEIYDNKFEYNSNAPMGFIAGGNIGINLGLGTFFLDIRYAGDFTFYEVKGDWGSRAIYKQGKVVFSAGIEFGIGVVKEE
jgi:TolB-like protein